MAAAEASNDQRGFMARNEFLLRRLHSLTGIVPVGVFLCVHLTVNWTVIFGGQKFQSAVDGIHLLDKIGLLTIVEIVGIFLPILFHAILGVVIWLSGRQQIARYKYGASIRYALQRWTALIAFAFILYHLYHMHWLGKPFGGGDFEPHHHAASSAAQAMQAAWWHAPVYLIGITAAVFHFANGIWTFAITWGIAISREAQRRVGYACTAVGFVLAAMAISSLVVLRVSNHERMYDEERGQPASAMAAWPGDPLA
jgi:succinate dehydrogenase / fumarate reductase cytochrome b subunit